jgi:hypothetical protein
MRRLPSFVAAALLALAVLFSGYAEAKRYAYSSSRVGRTDAQKVEDLRDDAERWIDGDGDWDSEWVRFRTTRELAFKATGSLEIDGGENGGASVAGWGKDSVRVVARIHANAHDMDRARELASSIRIVSQGGRLTAEGPEGTRGENWSVMFDVLAPRNTALTVESHNGPASATEMEGRIALSTVNGPVALRAVAGDVRARTENGPLSVILTGKTWRGAGLDASTENGPVAIRIPRGYSCTLETGTINGPMTVGIPITVQGRINVRQQHLSARLGSGGPPVRATTINGPASVSYISADAASEPDEVEN